MSDVAFCMAEYDHHLRLMHNAILVGDDEAWAAEGELASKYWRAFMGAEYVIQKQIKEAENAAN